MYDQDSPANDGKIESTNFTKSQKMYTEIGSVSLMGHSLSCFPSGHERHVPKEQATNGKGIESFLKSHD